MAELCTCFQKDQQTATRDKKKRKFKHHFAMLTFGRTEEKLPPTNLFALGVKATWNQRWHNFSRLLFA
jgi:hypothetical protein